MAMVPEALAPGSSRRSTAPVPPSGGKVGDQAAERLTAAVSDAAPEEALEAALGVILDASGATAGAICLYDQRHELMRLAAEQGLSDEGCKRLRSVRRGDMNGWDMPLHGLLNRRAYLIDSASKNRYVPALIEAATSVRTIACLPVYNGATALGSLVLVAQAPRALGERDLRGLAPLIRELARAIGTLRQRVAERSPPANAAAPAPSPAGANGTAVAPRAPAAPSSKGTSEALGAPTARQEALEKEVAALREAVETHAAQASTASAEAEANRAEVARLTAALEAARDGVRDHEAERQTVSAEQQALAAERETVAAELGQTRESLRRAEAELEELGRVAASREEELHVARESAETARGEVTRLTAALEAAEGGVREQAEQSRALLGAREAAETELAGARKALDDARVELRSLRDSVGTHEAKARAAQAEAAMLQSEVARLGSELRAAEGGTREREEQHEALAQERAAAAASLAEARAELDGARADLTELRALVEARNEEITGLREARAELDRARGELEAAEARVAEARKAAGDWQQRYAALEGRRAAEPSQTAPPPPREVAESPAPKKGPAKPAGRVPAEKPPAKPVTRAAGLPTGRGIVVIDVMPGWGREADGEPVSVVAPDASLGARIAELSPARIVVNLATPGALHALAGVRAAVAATRFVGCIATPDGKRVLPLGPIEPGLRPLEPDAFVDALGQYGERGTRVVTIGSDVDAFIDLRQRMAKQNLSVSMAWDAKQASDLVVMVRPQIVVVDIESLRDGCAAIASLAGTVPQPVVAVLFGERDPAKAFAAAAADRRLQPQAVTHANMLTRVGGKSE